MTVIDIIILIIIGIGAFRGFQRGLIYQLASIVGLIVGFFAARALYLLVAEKLSVYIPDTSMTILQILAFISIWVIVPLAFTLTALLFTRAAEMISLGMLNRMLGFVLGGIKWVFIVGLIINVIDFVDHDDQFINQTKKEDSTFYYPIKEIISDLFPIAKEVTDEYIYI